VTNALRYGFREGEPADVVLDLQRGVRRGRRWIGISVTDHGPGLSSNEKREVFQPFRRGRVANQRQIPGGGMGLSLVKSTLAHMKGRVQIRSVAGGGLSVILWLREEDEA
jgi:signal transduction histidine kinase